MKKIIAMTLVLILLFTLVSCKSSPVSDNTNETEEINSATQQEQSNIIKIGVFEKQTGDYAIGSKQSILGLKYANEVLPEIEISDETYKIKLDVAEFSASDDSVRQAAQKLVSDGVSVIIGSFDNGILSEVCDIFESAGIPVICPSGCSVKILENYKTVFSFTKDDFEQAQESAKYAFDNIMARKAVVISKLGDYISQTEALYFKECFEALGASAKILTFEDEINFAYEISGYDLIYAPVSQYYASDIINECESANAKISILGGSAWDSAATLEKNENVAFPVYTYSHCGIDTSSQFITDFSAWISNDKDLEYMNSGNSNAATASVLSYDAYMLFANSVVNAGSVQTQDIISQIKKIEYSGETGKISFDENARNKFRTSALKKADTYTGIFAIK